MSTTTSPERRPVCSADTKHTEIEAGQLEFRELNTEILSAARSGSRKIILRGVYGQRYIGTRLNGLPPTKIEIWGTPGNDLGSFMDGHILVVHGNAQDGVGNTMHEGEIIVEGRCGDILGMSATGGSILVREDAGYRAALHIKEHGERFPILMIGGTAQDFLGEYMAGGRVIVLGLGYKRHRMRFIGTGMHGGIIYIRGKINEMQLGEGARIKSLDKADRDFLTTHIDDFRKRFELKREVNPTEFCKVVPRETRPYSRLYA